MLNPLAAGTRLVRRTAAFQVVAVAALSLALLAKGPAWSMAALAGGGAVTAGCALYGALALGGGIAPAGGALARLVLGLLAKWFVVVATLFIAIAVAKLPPLAVIGGAAVALVAQVLAMAGGHRNGNP